jgi:Ser/Thr protein kinase RdoA (MazF antagonist)
LRPFEDLTLRGQIRRMRTLAWDALAQYDIQVARLCFLGWFTNLMFRVEAADGGAHVLRICTPGWRSEADLLAEVMWLAALENTPEIRAPVLHPARDGSRVVLARAEGVTGDRRCILMRWTPGVNLGKRLDEANLEKMGSLFARLHAQAESWTPPVGFYARRMDRVLAREEPDALFGEAALERSAPPIQLVWEQARQVVTAAYQRRYALPGLHVIHHDLWHDNIKLYRSRLLPLDFEDTSWGYPVQDIAMAMQDLMQDVSPERYDPLLRAFRRGYESLRPWPEAYEGEMDIFRVGRMLWVANYVAWQQRLYLNDHLQRLAPVLEDFFATGRLRKAIIS